MEIDRSLLTEDQRKELDRWTEFFNGPVWEALVNRHEPRIHLLQESYHKVDDQRLLGQIQGGLQVFYSLFVQLPDVINYEFLMATGQASGEEKGSDDDPVSPSDWRR
jgi:hypothetical protein